MIDLTVSLTADSTLQFLGAFQRQLPYATSVAINRTLDDAQGAIRAHIHNTFTLRRPDFIDRTVYIAPADRAKKDKLEGTVRIDPRRDFLAKFEDQREKMAQGGGSLAVPVFREDSPQMVIMRSDPLSLRNLMRSIDERAGVFKRLKGQRQKDVQRRAYLVKSARGTFIVGRLGAQTRVLYAFKRSVPITPDLEFKDVALRTAVEVWQSRAAEAIDLAISTAR